MENKDVCEDQIERKSHIRRLYLSDDSKDKTFQNDVSLPPLPVPELQETLKKYLKSVEPFVSFKQYEKTSAIVDNFKNGVGKTLQEMLKKRATQNKNWLADWWLKYAYLSNRQPLVPGSNMSGINPLNITIWNQPSTEARFKRDALCLWVLLDYFTLLCSERIRPQVSRKGKKFSMNQLRSIFNTTRIPKEGVDEVKCYFKTKSEGPCPRHIIVFCRGHMWLMDPWFSLDEQLTAPEIEEQLKYIEKISEALGDGQGVGALSFDNRESWAKNRRWLLSLSAENAEYLQLIDSAMIAFTLENKSPKDHDEASLMSCCLDPANSWADKSHSGISYKNGLQGSNSDHSPYDAMALASLIQFQYAIIEDEFKGAWNGSEDIRDIKMPKRLIFTLDDLLLSSIESIKTSNKLLRDNVDVKLRHFTIFGKSWIQKRKIHPDAFIQCALQLGYYNMYRKFAPTYESANTRQFYVGRTETIRSCTVEMMDFVEVMGSSKVSANVKRAKLIRALTRHCELMSECENGQGIDRHLMGLAILAAENGMPTPEIFTDPSYALSGGGGNFVLSTSTCGNTNILGGVVAMVKDGYGVFYGILPHRISFYMTSYLSGNTDLEKFSQSIFRALINLRELVEEPTSRL